MAECLLDLFHVIPMKPELPLSRCALFLDLDGTLFDLAPTPDSVVVPPAVTTDLGLVVDALGGAVAAVSGRPIADVDRLLTPLRISAAAEHGALIRTGAGAIERVTERVPPNWIRRLEVEVAHEPGIFIERKAHAVAIHFRRAPLARNRIHALAAAIAAEDPVNFEAIAAHMAVEIRPRSANKGHAVRRLMADAPFHGRYPVYAGDDVTDEDGIAAVCALGGIGLRVETWFAGEPRLVRQWLGRLARSAQG